MTEQLDKRLGSLRELFGVLQQVAGDTRGLFEASLISSQYENRGDWLGELAAKMGTASQLATIAEIEELWFEMQREMTESGKVAKYPGVITKMSGEKVNTEIVRVGAYALLGEGEYLQWDADTQSIVELPRQPAGREPAHAVPSDQRVLDGRGQGVAHVEAACHVWRRERHRVARCVSMVIGGHKKTGVPPPCVQAGLNAGWFVDFTEGGRHWDRPRRRVVAV